MHHSQWVLGVLDLVLCINPNDCWVGFDLGPYIVLMVAG